MEPYVITKHVASFPVLEQARDILRGRLSVIITSLNGDYISIASVCIRY